jgi:RHS repeat-associated protein
MHVTGNTYTSSGVDIAVRNPSGSSVAGIFVQAATGFRDVFTLPVTGTYTVVVDPRLQQTGTVTFLLSNVPANTGTTAVGAPTTITTTAIGENATRTFSGTAGQTLTLSVSGNTFNSSGVDIAVRNPSGGSVAGLFVQAATGFRDAFTLPVTGTYTVVIDPRFEQIGTLTFVLNNAPAGSAPSAPAGAETPAEKAGSSADASTTIAPDATGLSLLSTVTAAAVPTLTITAAELLANDRPGPDNESDQTLTVTSVTAGPFTHGTVTFVSGVVSYTPDADFVGNASFPYTICDNGTTNGSADPRCTTASVTVKVTANHPPVVSPQALSTAEDAPVSLTLTGTDSDGDPVTFVITKAPGHGTLGGTAPALTYTPAPDFNGVDSFVFAGADGKDQSAPATVTITVSEVNDPPVPQPNTVTARAGQQVMVAATTLAANDDPGPFNETGQTLTVTAVTPGPETHGTAVLVGGTVTFTPEPGFTGTAVIGYTVCDNGTTGGLAAPLCADSTLSIVANHAPVANGQSVQTSLTNPVPVVLSATDVDADPLTFAIVTAPQHGTLTGTAPNLTYKANAGFVGDDSFTFTASDALGSSAAATVTITVNDIPSPTLAADAATVRAGQSVLVDVLANDTAGSGTINAATLAISAAPTKGSAVLEGGKIRYTANAAASGADTLSYTVCDTGGGCATALVTVQITDNNAPLAVDDTYDVALGATLRPAVPGVLDNDTDPDTGEKLQARLVQGVGNGRLLLNGDGSFTYVPNSPGIDTFVYRVVDSSGAFSNDATVTIYITGPAGPPIVGNDRYELLEGQELTIGTPGLLLNDYSPNPRLGLTVVLQRDAAKGTLLVNPDGSFVYTPEAGFTGIDQFSYKLRDSEGRLSGEARVGITVKAGGPAIATVGPTSPAAGSIILGPTHFTATLTPPAGETVTSWTVSYRAPGGAVLIPLASGAGNSVAADFDPTLVRNGTYEIVIRAITSGGGVLVSPTGVSVEGEYKPGRYVTTFRDVALNSANIPIELYRTYDSINKGAKDLAPGWSLELANFKVETNGPLGGGGWSKFTCPGGIFFQTCYATSRPHFVTVTWPDGHVERFKFDPVPGSTLLPTFTTAAFKAEPGTTSTLQATASSLLLSGSDFYLGDFFSSDGVYDPLEFILTDKTGTKYRIHKRAGLLGITDRNGNTVDIFADGVDSSSGLSMTFVRDASNRITRIVAPGGNIDYTYDAAGDLTKVTYPNGTVHTFTYDGAHNLLDISGDGELVRSLHYDASGRLTSITNGNNETTEVSIDVSGHQEVITDAAHRLTTVNTFNDRGNLIRQDRVADGKTITTSATYDSLGRRLSSTDGLGHTKSQTYDSAGNVLTSTNENNKTTTYTYNAFGQVLTVTDPLNRVTTNVYDTRGNLLETTAPDNGKTVNTYDAAGNLLTTKDPSGRITTNTYNSQNHLTSTTDAGNHTTVVAIDPATGLLASRTDATGSTTTFGYDEDGNLTRVTDGNGHFQTTAYDAWDRVTSLTDATGKTRTFTYDSDGNIETLVDRNGQTTTFDYDANGRLITKTVPGAGTTTYTYDGFGRRLTEVNDTARITYTYDDADRVVSVTTAPTVPGTLPTATITYQRDPVGNVTSVQGPGGTTTYGYDAASQLTSITDPAGGSFTIGHDAAGRRTTMTRPNGVNDTTTYDPAGNLTSIKAMLGATVVGQSDYTYDTTGRRDTLTSTLGTASFGYDNASQLTSASFPAAGGLPAEQYSYDNAGNRTASATPPTGPFTYDNANRLLTDATTTYQYDGEGNMLSRTVNATGATTQYHWNAEHQLTGITYPDGTSSTFRYDPIGRRVAIEDGPTITRFVFDGLAIAAEYDGTNALLATYIRDPETPTLTYEMTRNGQRYFYVTDALGSTTHLVDANGAVANTYVYGAFGTHVQTGTVPNSFTYTGQLHHQKSGLLLFSLRAYDPTLGRFLSEDPAVSINPYAYVFNDPLNRTDITGGEATVTQGLLRGVIVASATGCLGSVLSASKVGKPLACLVGLIAGAAGAFIAGALAIGATGFVAGTFVDLLFSVLSTLLGYFIGTQL